MGNTTKPYVHECTCGSLFQNKTTVMIHSWLHGKTRYAFPNGVTFRQITLHFARPHGQLRRALRELVEHRYVTVNQSARPWTFELRDDIGLEVDAGKESA